MSTIYTARLTLHQPRGYLDITRMTGKEGIIFAPSWKILTPVLRKRKAGELTDAVWAQYVLDFTEEMRTSYRENRDAWEAVLARETVTLLCYCIDPNRCHRTILARDIFPKLGAKFGGER